MIKNKEKLYNLVDIQYNFFGLCVDLTDRVWYSLELCSGAIGGISGTFNAFGVSGCSGFELPNNGTIRLIICMSMYVICVVVLCGWKRVLIY